MAADFFFLFCLSGCIYWIFKYVWESYDDYINYALAVCLHVHYSFGRRSKCPFGRVYNEKRKIVTVPPAPFVKPHGVLIVAAATVLLINGRLSSYRCTLAKTCKHVLCFPHTVWLNCYEKEKRIEINFLTNKKRMIKWKSNSVRIWRIKSEKSDERVK